MPQFVQLIFGGSGIVPAAIVAIILNIAIPEETAPQKSDSMVSAASN